MSARRVPATTEPAAVEAFDGILADWLAAFTVPEALAAEMAAACAGGAAWAAGVAGVAARRAGWEEAEAVAWGIAVGALAGALDAARASLAPAPAAGGTADGPARALLAADGLMAAAHEALGSLPPERLAEATAALAAAFGDGGPWRDLAAGAPEADRPAWPALVPLALAPAAAGDPAGPWRDLAEAWRAAASAAAEAPGDRSLWDHPAAAGEDRALLRAAARARGA